MLQACNDATVKRIATHLLKDPYAIWVRPEVSDDPESKLMFSCGTASWRQVTLYSGLHELVDISDETGHSISTLVDPREERKGEYTVVNKRRGAEFPVHIRWSCKRDSFSFIKVIDNPDAKNRVRLIGPGEHNRDAPMKNKLDALILVLKTAFDL
jgi:hypothetical protein